MEGLKIQKFKNEKEQISEVRISGNLVVEFAQQFKDQIFDILDELSDHVKIFISEIDEIDVSGIQLIVAFISRMEKRKIKYQFSWDLSLEQRNLLENVGMSEELYLTSL